MDFEKITDWTYRIVRPDQSIRWIRDRIFPVRDVHGAVVRFAGIAQDITESKEAEQTVRKANRQLRVLSRRRIQEQEDERRRLSRELHDQIGQSLTAAKINVEALRSTKNPALVGRIDETAAILDQLLGQVRQISLDLRPPMLDDLGLVPALRSFVDEQGRRASVAVRFSAEDIPEKLDPEIQITCFRIAQEAITNAVRHAHAVLNSKNETSGEKCLSRRRSATADRRWIWRDVCDYRPKLKLAPPPSGIGIITTFERSWSF